MFEGERTINAQQSCQQQAYSDPLACDAVILRNTATNRRVSRTTFADTLSLLERRLMLTRFTSLLLCRVPPDRYRAAASDYNGPTIKER
jgi:hypothetical protein